MKKVITHGWDKYITTCNKCDCTFVYEISDVFYEGKLLVECPECEYHTQHNHENAIPQCSFDELMSDDYNPHKNNYDY